MRNKHPGTCYRCRRLVKAGEGHFERIPGLFPTTWRVQHAKCCIDAREKRATQEEQIVRLTAENARLREVVEAVKEVAPYGKHHCWFAPDGLCKTCSLRVPLAALNPAEEGTQHGND